MASSTKEWILDFVIFCVIMSLSIVESGESPHLETVFPSTAASGVNTNGRGARTVADNEHLSGLSQSPDHADGDHSRKAATEQSHNQSPSVNTAKSRAVTFEELIFGMERAEGLELDWTPFLFPNGTQRVGNGTEKSRRIHCVAKNMSAENTSRTDFARVEIVNSTDLLHRLSQKNETQGNCAVVLFYAPWCMFCARAAPHYNALARAFPQLDVVAIDAVHFSSLNSRYGTIAVPNILVFHNSKAVARFNSSTRTFDDMVSFVANVTGLSPNQSVSVLLEDYQGPLSSVPSNEQDLLLWLSWLFVVVFSSTVFAKSPRGQMIWNFIANLGAEHEHID